MSAKRIKKILIDKGLTIRSLAKKTGYSSSHISVVVHGHFKAPKARQAISKALGVDHDKLWGKPRRKKQEQATAA